MCVIEKYPVRNKYFTSHSPQALFCKNQYKNILACSSDDCRNDPLAESQSNVGGSDKAQPILFWR